MTTWKEQLNIPPDMGEIADEIDLFESQMELRRQGKIDEKVFAETRLRRGAYGQRYDNGQRHDGLTTRTLQFPLTDITKGPDTLWDAPGMMRLKIPYGGLNPEQLEVLAELADEEIPAAEARIAGLDERLQLLLIPVDPRDEGNLFLEIRAGTGGDEAAIFAGDLYRMYARYAERQGW